MMTWIGTRETREARGLANEADADDRQHRSECFTCQRATRQRDPAGRCADGVRLADAKREAAARLRKERELDKMPNPDQAPLFDMETAS